MKTEIRTSQIGILLSGCVAALILAGIGLGIATHDPEWLRRAGAAIAAIAAGAILLQIRTEVRIEGERRNLEGAMDGGEEADEISPMRAIELRLIAKRLERMHFGLTATRLKVAGYVISAAIVGELLHGFGDLLMCHVFAICANHQT